MNKTKLLYILCSVISLALSSCISDSFTTDPNHVLTFSADTVAFDTVITEQATATKQFMIYNRNAKQVRISHISVTSNTPDAQFYINVNGMKGSQFSDVELRGGDSIYVFVEAHVSRSGQDEPKEVFGRINFQTNGVDQHVDLTAWGQDVEILRGVKLTGDTEFSGAKPYVVYDSLVVDSGATLRLGAGTRLMFHKNASLEVYGRLLSMGTQERPVVLRGDRLDRVVGDISFDIISKQWGGVRFHESSTGNIMQYTDVHSTTYGVEVMSNSSQERTLLVLNSVFRNSAGTAFSATNAWIEAIGTEFSDAASSVLKLVGGKVSLTHCTLANYYLFEAVSDPLLYVAVNNEAGSLTPLQCTIDNSVFYGLPKDINMGELDGTEIYLRNCLLRSAGTDDAHFIACRWKGDPKYYTVREDYIFDYRVHNGSDAIAAGNRDYTPEQARYDRYGQDRFARDGVDVGAYVWVPEPEDEN